jgi:hypothetical protein
VTQITVCGPTRSAKNLRFYLPLSKKVLVVQSLDAVFLKQGFGGPRMSRLPQGNRKLFRNPTVSEK